MNRDGAFQKKGKQEKGECMKNENQKQKRMGTNPSSIISLFLTSSVAVVFSLIMTACGGGGGDTPQGGGVPQMGVGAGAMTIPQGFTFVAQSQPTQSSMFQQNPYIQGMQATFIPEGAYVSLMREAMGICDRNTGSDLGYFACNSYLQAQHVIALRATSAQANQVELVFQTGMSTANWGFTAPSLKDFALTLATGGSTVNYQGVYNPMVLNGTTTSSPVTIWPVNDNRGFEVRSLGPIQSAARGKGIAIRVQNGKLENTQFEFVLYYQGAVAGRGTFLRAP